MSVLSRGQLSMIFLHFTRSSFLNASHISQMPNKNILGYFFPFRILEYCILDLVDFHLFMVIDIIV